MNNILGESLEIIAVKDKIRQIAPQNIPVLLIGESGVGKELVAQAIHQESNRKDNLFVAINCAALSDGLLESELFGHEKGSFTGAYTKKIGKFELCNNGTIFLDEISSMSYRIQSLLLRVLQNGRFERVGGNEIIETKVRIISATNEDPLNLIQNKKLRTDLFFRLNTISITIPPLRERDNDSILLAKEFLKKYSHIYTHGILKRISKKALQFIKEYSWPGNIRELESNIQSALILSKNEIIDYLDLPSSNGSNYEDLFNSSDIIDNFERLISPIIDKFVAIHPKLSYYKFRDLISKIYIVNTLKRCNFNQLKTAKILGISRGTLIKRMKEHGLYGKQSINIQ